MIKPNAFTLVELLVVIAIIAVLLGLAFPAVNKGLQQAKTVRCLSNLKGIGLALQTYIDSAGSQRMPILFNRLDINQDMPAMDTVLLDGDNPESFNCPADKRDLYETTGTSYFWNEDLNEQPLSSLNTFNIEVHALIPVMSDKEAFHPELPLGVNLLYADYHVESNQPSFTVGP